MQGFVLEGNTSAKIIQCLKSSIIYLLTGVGHSNDADIQTIPEPVPRGKFKPVEIDGPPSYVVVDLETTDLSKLLINYVAFFRHGC